ncbi:MAG: GDP-mannose 4,6-dehydratase [Candidatus Nanosalina sp.]
MTNLVTGVAGFIGSHIAEELLRQGENVIGIDNFHPNYSEEIKRHNLEEVKETEGKEDLLFIEGSITDREVLDKVPEEIDTVFHAAAIPGVRRSVEKPSEYIDSNVKGTSMLLEHIGGLDKIVFLSSSSVYGEVEAKELPVQEERELNPKVPYALSKKQSEEIIRHYSELYGFEYSILRCFTVYGRCQRPDEAFTKFASMIHDGEPVTVYGDGEQSRDFTHVDDVVSGVLKAAEKGSGTYNIGTGRRVTVNEMVEALQKAHEGEVEKKYVEQPDADVRHTHADISKARKELGYEPDRKLEDGARECLDWVEKMKKKDKL